MLLAAALASLAGWLAFRFAAVLPGEVSAGLPTHSSRRSTRRATTSRGPVDAPLTLVEYARLRVPLLRPRDRDR